MQVLDGGRAFNGGNPPAEVSFGERACPQSAEGRAAADHSRREQKAWFKDRLRKSTATWKIWGNSQGALDRRADPQNLPPGLTKETWPRGHLCSDGPGDYGTAYTERAEIYDLIRDAKITGFAIVSGDRHSFWAGYATVAAAAGQVRAGRLELRRRLAVERRRHGSPTSTASRRTIRCARCFSPIGPARRSRTGPTTCC